MKTIRIGAGAGFAGDRIEPAKTLAESGKLDYLVFECLAERTIALAQLEKRDQPDGGFDPLLTERMLAVLPGCHRSKTRIITNMGAANPAAAARKTIEIGRSLGIHGLRVAYVEGDDVRHLLESFEPFEDNPLPGDVGILSANAYLGAAPVADALNQGADVVITGRVADPSLFLGAFLHAFNWDIEDSERLGQGIAVGHLLECAGQLTGGYFADPPYKEVPGLESLGFPFAEVGPDGSAVLTKLLGTGGMLNLQTCREQLLYEVLNPSAYITPDVTADFTSISLRQTGADRVSVSGGSGTARPAAYKVSVGVHDGWIGDASIAYAGPGALARATLARNILASRLSAISELRLDIIGHNALHGTTTLVAEPYEVRVRAAGRFVDRAGARALVREVESLYVNGPAAGTGVIGNIRENIAIVPALIACRLVPTRIHFEETS